MDNLLYRCMICKKIGTQSELTFKNGKNTDGHCEIGDLIEIKKPMEKWEVELRNDLQSKLADAIYTLGVPGRDKWIVSTGKQGKIEYEVFFHKAIRNMHFDGPGIKEQVDKANKTLYKDLTEKDLEDFFKSLTSDEK